MTSQYSQQPESGQQKQAGQRTLMSIIKLIQLR